MHTTLGEGQPTRRPDYTKPLAGCTILDIEDEGGRFKLTLHFGAGWGVLPTRCVCCYRGRADAAAAAAAVGTMLLWVSSFLFGTQHQ
jgi:hypothetical protein